MKILKINIGLVSLAMGRLQFANAAVDWGYKALAEAVNKLGKALSKMGVILG